MNRALPNNNPSHFVTPVIICFLGTSFLRSSIGFGKKSPSITGVRSNHSVRVVRYFGFPSKTNSSLCGGTERKNSTSALFCSNFDAKIKNLENDPQGEVLDKIIENNVPFSCIT